MVVWEIISVKDNQERSGLVYLLETQRQLIKKDHALDRIFFTSKLLVDGQLTIFGIFGQYGPTNDSEHQSARDEFLQNVKLYLHKLGYRYL